MSTRQQVRMGVFLAAVVLVSVLSTPVSGEPRNFSPTLKADPEGFQEVPAVSTTGSGKFRAKINNKTSAIEFKLTYEDLEGIAAAAHIHLGQEGVNGGVIAFLCGGGGKPACPASGTVTGTIIPDDIIGPEGQGIAPGEFDEVVEAIRAGVVYANVHSDKHPGGEIRGQVR